MAFALAALTTGLAQVARRDSPRDRPSSMSAMGCATLGGLAGGLVAYVAMHAVPGPGGLPVMAELSAPHAPPHATGDHLRTLLAYLMNGGMGAMLGASVGDCPSLRVRRPRGLRLRLPRVVWIRG